MSMFDAYPIAGSGMEVSHIWLDTIAGNIANMNDAVPGNFTPVYQEQVPVVEPLPPSSPGGVGQGAVAITMAFSSPKGILAYQPRDPIADAQGYVRYPAVDLGQQMVDLVMAQTSYQANAAVITQAHAAYQSALTIGS
jgi:flagellar basal-body rod protein FlgC